MRGDPRPADKPGVAPIELFFDLVFVCVITQITHLVEHAHAPLDYLRALLVLVPIWWMYAGYTWLANIAGATTRMRLVLIAAMAGFLVMALSIPRVFGDGALAFGLSYLFIVLVHLAAFSLGGGLGLGRAMVVARFNLAAAALLIGAAFAGPRWGLWLFVGASAVIVLATLLRSERRFSINAAHFAERHGLVILIALGESVIAIALGASQHTLGAVRLGEIVLSLALVAALWWSYFDREDGRAERLLVAAGPEQRARMGILGYWYAHLALIAGIVVVAAGIRLALEHGTVRTVVWLLAGGLCVFMLGDVAFRLAMGMRPVLVRVAGALLALGVGLIGLRSSWIAIGTLAALTAAVIAIEGRLEPRPQLEPQPHPGIE
jgi:low temperature requirement protein LtrA